MVKGDWLLSSCLQVKVEDEKRRSCLCLGFGIAGFRAIASWVPKDRVGYVSLRCIAYLPDQHLWNIIFFAGVIQTGSHVQPSCRR